MKLLNNKANNLPGIQFNCIRPWSRATNNITSAGNLYNQIPINDLNMRRKAEILLYKNTGNQTQKQYYAMLAKGKYKTKNTWASQVFKNPQFKQINNNSIVNQSTLSNPNTHRLPQKGFTLICSSIKNNCAMTYSSDVPGKPELLCYIPEIPLVNYKVKRTYLAGGTKWPSTTWAPGSNGFPVGKSGVMQYLPLFSSKSPSPRYS